MTAKRSIPAACAVLILSVGVAVAGPCNTGSAASDKDAGSGPVTVGQAPSGNVPSDANQHPPTGAMNRASGEAPASSEDAQRQMQSQPTAAQQAEGTKPNAKTADEGC